MNSFITLNGLTYAIRDEGHGPPLLLLHGFTGSSESWGAVLPALAERFRVLALELPGHGQTGAPSDPARYAMDAVAADIAALLPALAVSRVHLLGYSMGGRLALYFARHYLQLVASLTLESASPGLATAAERFERTAADNALAGWIEAHSLSEFVARWAALPLFDSQRRLPADVRERQRKQRLGNSPQGLANSLRGMGTGRQPSLWSQLAQVGTPTLLLAGELDLKFRAINEQMAAVMPDAQLTIVAEAGHTIHLEQPEAFTARVLRFLTGCEHEVAEQLPGAEEDHEDERGQRHLLEPGIERGQVGRPLNDQAVADQQGGRQQKEVLPDAAAGYEDIDHSQRHGQEQ
jgi:2-succinyl-6-hydroxy-2,4-cyclohexadiene-1-carboxylate synthase